MGLNHHSQPSQRAGEPIPLMRYGQVGWKIMRIQLDTFGACNLKYILRFGLRLKPWGVFSISVGNTEKRPCGGVFLPRQGIWCRYGVEEQVLVELPRRCHPVNCSANLNFWCFKLFFSYRFQTRTEQIRSNQTQHLGDLLSFGTLLKK